MVRIDVLPMRAICSQRDNTAVRTPRKHLRKFPHETKLKEKV